jgi:hypothetical protein
MAKSLACRLKITHSPSMIPECKHGLRTVCVRPTSHNIELSCFSHNQGDSGCPCIANRIGMTIPGARGFFFLWCTHRSWNA